MDETSGEDATAAGGGECVAGGRRGAGRGQATQHRLHRRRRHGLERRELPRLGPGAHAQHRRPGVPRGHPQRPLRAAGLHAVPVGHHDREVRRPAGHAGPRDPGRRGARAARGQDPAAVPQGPGLRHQGHRQVAPGPLLQGLHAHLPRVRLPPRLLERRRRLLRLHICRQGSPRVRPAREPDDGVAVQRQVRDGRVHRGGGAADPGARRGAPAVPLLRAPRLPPRGPLAAHQRPAGPHQQLLLHLAPRPPHTRSGDGEDGRVRGACGDSPARARHAQQLHHCVRRRQRGGQRRQLGLQLPVQRHKEQPLGGCGARRGCCMEPPAAEHVQGGPRADAHIGLAAHAVRRSRR
ncbi:uncharacterized protein LOC126285108 [Schistocerca gregaria]|uniref:uncharacterized protein LOC126285108 n=1 Tax=Schistocerca gregaria TaxID=7010 RepID=UPI00211E3189|nr:uncharacterized protein LOC126285108 [Schistocerca gregaria]